MLPTYCLLELGSIYSHSGNVLKVNVTDIITSAETGKKKMKFCPRGS